MDSYKCLRIFAEPADPWLDVLSYRLTDEGFEGCRIESGWLEAYITSSKFQDEVVNRIRDEFPDVEIRFEIEDIPATNWNELWESNFQPIEIGREIFVYAPFHKLPEGFRYPLLITPKMSFGTGHHHTTRMMMEAMLKMDFSGKSVLDVGCGSGILAILAEKMNAGNVLAIDIDDWCIANSAENSESNNCKRIVIAKATVNEVEKNAYNIILANINRNVILNDIGTYFSLLGQGGELVLSGFFKTDVADIDLSANSLGLKQTAQANSGEWAMIKYLRP